MMEFVKKIHHSDVASSTGDSYHIPVLLHECIEGLNIRPDGIYVDCTMGGGGHTREILKNLGPTGRLVTFDQDPDAAANVPQDERVIFVPQNFKYLKKFLRINEIDHVDGILADLGVSSHQFDVPERGFSTRFNANLDMRMNPRNTLTAAEILNTYSEAQLHKLFERYGEVTNAKTLAKTIVTQRAIRPFTDIDSFKLGIQDVIKGNPNKYFAQVFQALRIEVNDELGALEELLEQVPSVLAPAGRVAIITFHSLEDRIVKQFFKTGAFDEIEVDAFGNRPTPPLKLVNKKPITASDKELKMNNRSRSAKLRIAEKK